MGIQSFDYSIVIGGEAGQGMQMLGVLLVKAFLRMGHYVSTLQSYQNRIRGGHNYYQIRVASEPIHSTTRPIDILLALDSNTLKEHLAELSTNASIIYNSDKINPPETNAKLLGLRISVLFPDVRKNEIYANSIYLGAIAGLMVDQPEAMHFF